MPVGETSATQEIGGSGGGGAVQVKAGANLGWRQRVATGLKQGYSSIVDWRLTKGKVLKSE